MSLEIRGPPSMSFGSARSGKRRDNAKVRARADKETDTDGSPLAFASRLVASPIYSVYLQGVVFVVLLGLVDAAYSGDWSRIGAISTEQEDQLKTICTYLALFHTFCTAVSVPVASYRGIGLFPSTLKVAAVGGLALLEVLLRPVGDDQA